jgi:hypothetical protein
LRPLKPSGCLELGKYAISDKEHEFDFDSIQPEQLARILEASRRIHLYAGVWNAAQSIGLATRSFPLQLTLLGGFSFQDEGTAFVDALQKSQASFGSLRLYLHENGLPFTRLNLQRLLQLEGIFERLSLHNLNEELIRLALCAKVDAVDYHFRAKFVKPDDFDGLAIAAKDLNINIYLEKGQP